MRAFKLLATCITFAAVASTAVAQNDPPPPRPAGGQPEGDRPPRGGGGGGGRQGGPALAPEKAKAAQELQASGVSKRLGIDAEKTKGVVKAYTEARESFAKAQEKLMADMRDKMQNSDDRQAAMTESRKAMEDMVKTEREKLEKALASSMSTDQVTKASASLGAFGQGRQWDTMTNTISEFKLDADKQQTALNAVEDYVVALAKTPRPGPDGDREAAQKAMRETREKLNAEMKKLLSEEQLKKFEEVSRGPAMRGGGGGPGGGGGGRDGGR